MKAAVLLFSCPLFSMTTHLLSAKALLLSFCCISLLLSILWCHQGFSSAFISLWVRCGPNKDMSNNILEVIKGVRKISNKVAILQLIQITDKQYRIKSKAVEGCCRPWHHAATPVNSFHLAADEAKAF